MKRLNGYAIPVVHGHWIYDEEPGKDGNVPARCSVCFAGDLHSTAMMNKVPHCWKCGARMDGGEAVVYGMAGPKMREIDAVELRNISGCPLSMCKEALQYASERDGGCSLAIAFLKAKTLSVKTGGSFDERVQRFIE